MNGDHCKDSTISSFDGCCGTRRSCLLNHKLAVPPHLSLFLSFWSPQLYLHAFDTQYIRSIALDCVGIH